jgi:hypothetical protein
MYRFFGVAATLLVAVPTVAASAPDRWGLVKLRMHVEDVRKAYPQLAPAPRVTSPAFFTHPSMGRYVLMQTRIPELKEPVDVEFRFWNDQLWTILVYYGKNPTSSVVAYLTTLYGPSQGIGSSPAWVGPRSKLVVSSPAKWFSINDNDLARDAQQAYIDMQSARTTAGKATPPAANTPSPAMTPP